MHPHLSIAASLVGLFLFSGCSTHRGPELTDEVLLDKVQHQTFEYFYRFAHPASGMARVSVASGDTVSTGGSGFGLMCLVVGMERGFITRQEGVERIGQTMGFLEGCERYHGAWPRLLNGATGETIPADEEGPGADLVETAFLVQGLLTARQYLDGPGDRETGLVERISRLWEGVEWDWFTGGGQQVLYGYWSPESGESGREGPLRRVSEALIAYVLAASSPTHPVESTVYHEGYAMGGAIVNGKAWYGITLPLGEDRGGPLRNAQYAFLGLDPRNLSDRYASYWEQNVNHTLINRSYCIHNPKRYRGYGEDCWGLTTSDDPRGYRVHSPTSDLGVIAPVAAIASIPYTPGYSLKVLRRLYYHYGDRIWCMYGFRDAFRPDGTWFSSACLAVDQGPVVIMIENYRTGLLWKLFMSVPEVRKGLRDLGFTF